MKLWERIAQDPVFYAIRIICWGLFAIALAIVLLGCATVTEGKQTDGSYVVVLPPEMAAQCDKEGGCSIISEGYEKQLIREAAKHFCGVDI